MWSKIFGKIAMLVFWTHKAIFLQMWDHIFKTVFPLGFLIEGIPKVNWVYSFYNGANICTYQDVQ